MPDLGQFRPFRMIKRLVLLLLALVVGYFVYRYLYRYTFVRDNYLAGLVMIWLVTAYLTIPRVHRWLTKVYLPNYYIGRTRTGDGLLGDPVNLAFIGSKQQILTAMEGAGWVRADELSLRSGIKMVTKSISRQSYPNAPVSSLFLFGHKEDLAFQQAVGGTTSKRHHIRFWKCPDGWYLPGGAKAEWLAAATYDRKVGISTLTLQVTHKIEADIDVERDYVIESLHNGGAAMKVNVVKNFTNAYHDRNGGGDRIHTDGALPFITLTD